MIVEQVIDRRVTQGRTRIEPAAIRTVPRQDVGNDAPAPTARHGGYAPSTRARPVALAASVALVGLTGLAAATLGPPAFLKPKERALEVITMELQTPPPPQAPPLPAAEPKLDNPARQVVAPPPLVQVALDTPPVAAAPTPTLPAPVMVAGNSAAVPAPVPPAPQAPAPPAPVDGGDLAAKVLSATPPAYPVECRRRREQGTVRLRVLVGSDGRVADIAIAESSGVERLDRAALGAVKRWRWSPVLREGTAVMVRGIVSIPFVLRG